MLLKLLKIESQQNNNIQTTKKKSTKKYHTKESPT